MAKKKTVKNTIANLASKGWGIISAFIFIPLYIAYLGEEVYGLVSFFATLQSVLTLLGASLSGTLRREFAVGDDSYEVKNHKYKLLRSVENIYVVIAFIIFLICFAGKGFIVTKWLNLENISSVTVETVLTLMGISIGLQLIGNLWHGCILGSGNQVIANVFSVGWASLKSLGSVIICITTSSIVYFYIWHIVSDCLYLCVERIYLSHYIGKQCYYWKFKDFSNLKLIWKYTLGLFAISIIAVINKQLDKAVISAFLSLKELGAYSLAVTLGSLTLILPNAVSVAVFATFTREYTTNKGAELIGSFELYSKITAVVATCMGAFIAVFASDLILVWSGSNEYVAIVNDVAPFVVMGSAILSLQEVPYSLALSHGNTKINNIIGIVSLPFVCVLNYFAVKYYGLMGAGIVYFSTMTLQTIIYVIIVTKRYTQLNIFKFVICGQFLPCVVSVLAALALKTAITQITNSSVVKILVAVAGGGITLLVLVLFMFRNNEKIKNCWEGI